MTNYEIETQLKTMLVENSLVIDNVAEINQNSSLSEDLQIDSLTFISMAIDLEKTFGIDLRSESELFLNDITYSDLIKVIQKLH